MGTLSKKESKPKEVKHSFVQADDLDDKKKKPSKKKK